MQGPYPALFPLGGANAIPTFLEWESVMSFFNFSVRAILGVALVLGLVSGASAQARATGGAINGVVKDSTGAVIGGAAVTIRNTETGVTRELTANAEGEFRAPALDAGNYEIVVNANGFAAQNRRVILQIGQTATVEVQLSAGGATDETVVVTDSSTVVEVSRTQQATTINQRAVKDLPVNGRNFLDFIRLTPGINTDPRGGDYSAGGLRGTFNSLLIDGSNNDNTFFGQTLGRTGVRAPYQFSQSSVKEFQVNVSSFAAEFGRAGGAVVNVITKSGTNEFHGEAFEFFRDRSLNANQAFLKANNRPRPPFRVNQFGGSIGGPVIKNKLFFFFAYDGQRRNDPVVVLPVGGIPAVSPTFPQAVRDRLVALTAPYQQGFNQNVYMGKVDWQINDANRLSVRYNRQLFTGTNLENGGQIRAESATGDTIATTDTVNAQITTIITPNLINEGRFLFSRDQQLGTANSTDPETTILVPGSSTASFVFGRNFFSPRETTEKRGQLIEALTYVRGNHTYKMGFDFIFNRILNFFPGTFGGRYTFASYDAFAANAPGGPGVVYQQAFAGVGTNGPRSFPHSNEYAFFVQDSWNIHPRLNLYYGLRYDAQAKNPPPLTNNNANLIAFGIRTGGLRQDYNNWAPRVGFAWNVFGDNKTVVRGGYGIYYGRTPSIITGTAHTQNGISVQTVTFNAAQFPAAGLTYPNVFSSFPSAGTVPPLELFFFSPNYVDPMVHQASFGVERELFKDWSLSVNYLMTRGIRLSRTRDINLPTPTLTTYNIRQSNGSSILATDPLIGTVQLPRFTAARPVTGFGRLFQFESTGDSIYHALAMQMTKRFSHNFQLLLSYTWSKAIDNRPDQTVVTAGDTSRNVQNSFNINDERAESDINVPHRFVFSGVWDLNYFKGVQNPVLRYILSNWSLSGIQTVASGQNYSAFAGGDVNNDGTGATDRAPVIGANFTFGRNTFRRPVFASTDFRITRAFPIRDRYRVEFVGEFFNAFNRFNVNNINTNLFRFSNNVGGTPTFGTLAPNAALTFGAVNGNGFDPRVVQLAAKFVF